MNLRSLGIFFLVFLFCFPVFSQQSSTPKSDPAAEQLLAKLSGKYKTFESIKADFTLKIQLPESENDEEQKGRVFLSGNKFKLNLGDQEIVCDNKTIWTYLKDVNELQINYFEEDDEMFNPSRIFTMYESDFIAKIREAKIVNGKKGTVLELSPVDKEQAVFKIILTIDEQRNEILESTLFEKSGIRYTYLIDKFSSNLDLADDFFTFNKSNYPGLKVVDLR